MNDIDKYSDLVVKHDQIVDSLKLWLVNNYVRPPLHILEDLNKCIELYPNFAEAYYNRGLILLRQGKSKQGIQDLSKAGELGLVQAYSVLKRATAE